MNHGSVGKGNIVGGRRQTDTVIIQREADAKGYAQAPALVVSNRGSMVFVSSKDESKSDEE
jgi:hypothetical protein